MNEKNGKVSVSSDSVDVSVDTVTLLPLLETIITNIIPTCQA